MRKHRYFYSENGQRVEELINGKWVRVTDHQPGVRSHSIIRDQIGEGVRGVYNPATMKKYDSRSRYHADTRAAGCEVIGNDQPMKGPPKATVKEPMVETIKRTIYQLENGNG